MNLPHGRLVCYMYLGRRFACCLHPDLGQEVCVEILGHGAVQASLSGRDPGHQHGSRTLGLEGRELASWRGNIKI